MRYEQRRAGFTLIELMVVIVVIAILATIVGLSLRTGADRARGARHETDSRALTNAITIFYDDWALLPASWADLSAPASEPPARTGGHAGQPGYPPWSPLLDAALTDRATAAGWTIDAAEGDFIAGN